MGAISLIPLGKAVLVIASAELADDNATAGQRPIRATAHANAREAEREGTAGGGV
jgi:hypothetical protein